MAGKMWYTVKYKLGKQTFRTRVYAENPATAEYLIRGQIKIVSIEPDDYGFFESLKSIIK